MTTGVLRQTPSGKTGSFNYSFRVKVLLDGSRQWCHFDRFRDVTRQRN